MKFADSDVNSIQELENCGKFFQFSRNSIEGQLFYNKNVCKLSNLWIFLTAFFDHSATYLHSENTVRSIAKLDQTEHFGLSKKAAVESNFCLIGKIHHNFLVLRTIVLACITFMPIQNRVFCDIMNGLQCRQVTLLYHRSSRT